MTLRRIAVVNRGESAMRLIHAVRDLNAAARDDERIVVIALHTTGERRAMFVREADVAYDLGPASARPYLNYATLERALRHTHADAVWVGWGFVAEDPDFAELCERIGITFIGPSAEAMRKLGDKIGSKLLAEEVGVPVAPWSRGPVGTLDEAKAAAARIGYPLMLKATAGGGGRGIRVVTSDEDLAVAYERTRDEAERAFGSGVVFLEQLVTGARHVEVQVIADGQGTAWAIGVRDCSIQRRNQKIIEESSSPLLDEEQTASLKQSAERLARAVGYAGAGTVEFLYHPQDRFFAFLEVNTRLQVEHPITESVTGTDLVKAQIHIAGGGRLTGDRPAEIGHAVEARLNAEDPDRDFAPSPGRIERLDFPTGPGIRVDTGVGEGDTIPADFDSMIAKIIAHGRDREEALARLRRAMRETTVVIEGGTTNKSFILDLLDRPEVVDGRGGTAWADTGWIDRVRAEGGLVQQRHSGVAVVVAGIRAYEDAESLERIRLLETAHGGRPQVQHQVGRPVEFKLRGTVYQVTVLRTGPHAFRVTVASGATRATVDAVLDRIDAYTGRITIGGHRYRLITAAHGPVHLVEVDGVTHRISQDEGGVLRAQAPALIVAAPVTVDDEVAAGSPVLVLESMKMETVLPAPFDARVRELLVAPGSQVETGTPLIRLEPVGDTAQAEAKTGRGTGPSGPSDLDLPDLDLPLGPEERVDRALADMTAVLLGYDSDPADDGRTLSGYLDARAESGELLLPAEINLLEIFADAVELGRNRPAHEETHVENRVHSPREYFHSYLRSLDVDRGGLPADFVTKLGRVLRHYGVRELDRTPDLERAVFRIFLAQHRTAPEVALATSILQQWIEEPPPESPVDEDVHEVLDRLIQATQRRFPVVGDLARSVRFRWFDQPLVDRERRSVLHGVRDEIRILAQMHDSPQRSERIAALAAVPERLVGFLAERIEDGWTEREPMLSVLVQRHYREYDLSGLRELVVDDRPFAVADYVLDERPTTVIATVGTADELTAGSALDRAVTEQQRAADEERQLVVDVYLTWPEQPESPDEASAELARRLGRTHMGAGVRRVAVAACPGGDRPVGYFTFRPRENVTPEPTDPQPDREQLVEDRLVRGVHPMVGRRLNLWRLRDFDLTRLDAPHDVLLYHCVARDNPTDQRLVALAQVRQLVVIRDESGAITALPHAERAIAQCMEGIRRAIAHGRDGHRLDTNHVWVQVWPPVEADIAQLTALQDKIAPMTADAGIEEVLIQGDVVVPDGTIRSLVARFSYQPGSGVVSSIEPPPTDRLKPMDDYVQKVLRARRRGAVYPYEAQAMIAGPGGTATEYDLDESGTLVPVDRPYGQNRAGIICGVITTPTPLHPEGITRVLISGDPLRSLGALAEPECARVIAALDLAERMQVPVEWYALSAGARISMDSGTENMDWVARALKRIVGFTQAGGEINVVVAGINVGAQPYWNAEATMLMHTRGVLIMTPDSAMVLTGKQSLDFSGGVSAEDNFGIGGYDRVMGPNGQAQYWAPDLAGAVGILLRHYEHTFIQPGEAAPRRVETTDPVDRDVTGYPHSSADSPFSTVGEIFSATSNPERKKPFDIRTVMRAVSDQDRPPLERWADMADADTSVVQDAHIGGHPVCLIGIESHAVPRTGFPPADGPDAYSAGTLFPRSSKKVARGLNAASGNRPVVVLANLSGFDGSPESMRNLQLEYGAEIGRAIVNFDGPIVFVVISRYHGGAFVVFSKTLNPGMTVLAVEGSYASVIGGAPAAAVVFSRDVDRRTAADPRVSELETRLADASDTTRAEIATELAEVRSAVRSEMLGRVASEFDGVHSIHRAVEVGSVDAVISAAELRPRIVEVLDRARVAPAQR